MVTASFITGIVREDFCMYRNYRHFGFIDYSFWMFVSASNYAVYHHTWQSGLHEAFLLPSRLPSTIQGRS